MGGLLLKIPPPSSCRERKWKQRNANVDRRTLARVVAVLPSAAKMAKLSGMV
jgi:hypothetical protein